MAKLTIFVSQTIVLFFVSTSLWASPSSEVPNSSGSEEQQPASVLDDGLAISDPGHVTATEPPDARYYPYRQQLTFRVGAASQINKTQLTDTVIGFQYLLPKFLSPKWEAGADLHKESRSHISFGRRWIIDERSYFRPSLKVSLDHGIQPEYGLVSFAHYENYFIRFSAAIEYVFANPYSVRIEPEVMLSADGFMVCATLGLSHGW